MKFAEVLPYLEAGRRVRRVVWYDGDLFIVKVGNEIQWHSGNLAKVDSAALLASDWEVVEEPAPVKPEPRPHVCSCNEALRQDVSRLTQELHESRQQGGMFLDTIVERDRTIARLTREREACMCVSSDAPGARCLMPSGHPGKIHSNGKQAWLC